MINVIKNNIIENYYIKVFFYIKILINEYLNIVNTYLTLNYFSFTVKKLSLFFFLSTRIVCYLFYLFFSLFKYKPQ